MKRRRETSYVPAGAFINPTLALGDYDDAFVWFERAYEEKSNILQLLKVHPFFDPVRNDVRFKGCRTASGSIRNGCLFYGLAVPIPKPALCWTILC